MHIFTGGSPKSTRNTLQSISSLLGDYLRETVLEALSAGCIHHITVFTERRSFA